MSSDRELLELAAKAVSLNAFWDDVVCRMRLVENNGKTFSYWQPLHDDGDALRLAVKTGMLYTYMHDRFEMFQRSYKEELDNDNQPSKATRRAIVRAAAEIGRKKSDV